MSKQLINEVKRFQKIAGLLNENWHPDDPSSGSDDTEWCPGCDMPVDKCVCDQLEEDEESSDSESDDTDAMGGINEEGAKYRFQDPEFQKIAVPVMNDMLTDCLDNYNGDFDDWAENGMSQPSQDVEAGLETLEQMSSPEEVEKFKAAAYRQIQDYIEKHS